MSILKPFIRAHGLEVALEKIVIVPIIDVVQQLPGRCVGDLNFEYRRIMWKGELYASVFDVPVHEYVGLSPSGVAHRLWRNHVLELKVER